MDIDKKIEQLENKIDKNMDKIINNMNELHKHEEKINKNANKIKENSYALEILRDLKKEKEKAYTIVKRLITALIIVLIMWFVTIGYLVYILNDIGIEETTTTTTTQEITDVDSISNSNIVNGDNYGKDKTN